MNRRKDIECRGPYRGYYNKISRIFEVLHYIVHKKKFALDRLKQMFGEISNEEKAESVLVFLSVA